MYSEGRVGCHFHWMGYVLTEVCFCQSGSLCIAEMLHGVQTLVCCGRFGMGTILVSGNSQCRVSTNKREIALLIIRETRMLKRERV
ncbi:hypothetical protein HBH92_232320 [Parastagonospora nodorum]|nr:hypothetical protein HBH52_030950 [Parastagonospora nodorum]KAH4400497.1 hypothetical protein HBH92_232320 [Parastagonospora nodorum]KAH4404468.1 hypothetical protein HBH93_235400 [Parastagonospora nodorum]KAH4428926.1 hypothetical protein HBH91_239610 [Parastagonospora nodorum]KAH4483952.1 hypothetical protein HBH89_231390 [Parastagonospora nodorum]